MIEAGSIVLQRETCVNGVNTKDNKKNRLSVVLFEFTFNDIDYVCTCPITNRIPKKYEKHNLYIPYQILGSRNLCNIKLNRAFIYNKTDIQNTGLKLNVDIVLKMYHLLSEIDEDILNLDKEHYMFIKNNIKVLKDSISKNSKEEVLRKKKRKDKN